MSTDIVLRKMESKDLEMVRAWRNAPEVASFMYTDNLICEEQQIQWWHKIKDDATCIYWIIEHNDTQIGLASLTNINLNLSSCYWAFYLSPSVPKGGGIGSKIEFEVLECVFNDLGLQKLRCEVMVFNDKVINMHEKFGFRREAYYRQHVKKDGKWIDVVGLAILKTEWKYYQPHFKKLFNKV